MCRLVFFGLLIGGCGQKVESDGASDSDDADWLGYGGDDGVSDSSGDGSDGGSGANSTDGAGSTSGNGETDGSNTGTGGDSDGGSTGTGETSGAGADDGESGGEEAGGELDDGGEGPPPGLAVLGWVDGSIDTVDFRVVGTRSDGLNVPRDLAFNPDVDNELWVVNRTDDSVSVFADVGTEAQSSEHIIDPYALHFMDEVSSIAFGAAMHEPTTALNFATCQESTNTYDGSGEPNYFMGPTLWSSDLDIFGKSSAEAVAYLSSLYGFYVDLGSHLDMLHESPLCVGIAHDYDNVYWVFDGYNESIYRYDFQEDHGPGFDDHSDGVIVRYAEGRVAYEPDVPSHLVLDHESRLLYIADTGNNRIAVLDTESGEAGEDLERSEPGTIHYEMVGATLSTFIDGDEFGMVAPSGVDIIDDILFVTDNETSEIIAFNMSGEEVDRLDTRLAAGSLMGIAVRSMEDIWLVSATEDRIYRLQPVTE